MKKWFYEKNESLLRNHVANKLFEEVLVMSEPEFRAWVADMRQVVVKIWDEDGIPPRVGFDEDEIKSQLKKMESFNTKTFLVKDLCTGTEDVIRNTSIVGNAANQWFPTMMKTKINYTSDTKGGLSIYDHFKDPNLLEKMITYGRRHFKRDSFYHYSNPVLKQGSPDKNFYTCETGVEWLKKFESSRSDSIAWDYWIEPKDSDTTYTGYDDKLRDAKWLRITRDELNSLDLPKHCLTNVVDYKTDAAEFQIRLYQKGQRLFPVGLKAFRISVCQYAVNFPPLTAKYLYERYLERGRSNVIWDPSSGWGGRILGAMSVSREYKIHYVGTDPNTDHNTENGRIKYHELADYYNSNSSDGTMSFLYDEEPHTYEIYQCGSEVMREQPGFQKYKGKVDLVFTSPPYFAKELYSQDAEQSATKFDEYSAWLEGFLKPTLATAVEWVKPGGYILWNIADAKFGNQMLDLEAQSINTLKSLGMEYVETLKMALARMPGGNRIDPDTGIPMTKNFCQIQSTGKKTPEFYKFEPITVWRKP